ncbi:L-threonine 3-dehydrogenase [Soehngenia saccharolytica]|nr:L-threonine 3-dehydrogenase [Soehngenia saccharolytica]
MKKILITGALGQIGSELTVKMRELYGRDNVVISDIEKKSGKEDLTESGPFEIINVLDAKQISEVVDKYNIDTIVNLAAILSAVGEKNPNLCWQINMTGLYNILEIAREKGLKIFTPSSIAVFGPNTPKDLTPQDTIMRPTTMYGVTKVSGELLCDYYYKKFGVDTRGVRFPGIISYNTLPGGGTTDYAVHIYYDAVLKKSYTSFIDKGTYMDMMYIPDALDAVINLLEADGSKLIHRNAFNITAMSIEPEDIANSIRKFIPEFKLDYDVDPVRQKIAESWPNSLDDSEARKQWGWKPKYDLDSMTKDMLEKLKIKLNVK